MNTARVEKQIDNRLNDQFRYFRREFMEAASTQGVTMPLELVEDKSGRFFTFVNANGPRYLLQIIHTQTEASTIMRCAISLLIITMSILRRKIPSNRPKKITGSNWMSLLSGNINGWAQEILSSISDGAAVSICINLLAKSKILVIRELLLTLLALLVNTSEEAVIQMLTSPNHQQMSAKEMEEKFRKENPHTPPNYKMTIDEKVKYNPSSTHGSCLSVMFSIVADNRNHFSIVSACSEVVMAMTSGNHQSTKIAVSIAQTSIQGPPPKERKESQEKILLKTVLNPRSNSSPGTRHAPIKGDAEQTGTADHRKGINSLGSDGDALQNSAPPEVKLAEVATWDAIHILIQFLLRFFRYTDVAAPDQSWNSISAGDRQRLVLAHNRTVHAVSNLITLAPEVGYYIYQMRKARHIVLTSAKYFLSSHMTTSAGLPVKERGNAVLVVSRALEVLSPEYQSKFITRSSSRVGSPSTRPMNAPLSSCNEDEPAGNTSPDSDKRPSKVTPKSSRPSAIERADSRKESILPVVKVSHHSQKNTKSQSNYPNHLCSHCHLSLIISFVGKKKEAPQQGGNSLVEYAHLFSEGSDWVSIESTNKNVNNSANEEKKKTSEEFEQEMKLQYEQMKREEQRRKLKQSTLSGNIMIDIEDRALIDNGNRPNTAPTGSVCEFFKCMPSTPGLPRRLTAVDITESRPGTAGNLKSLPSTAESGISSPISWEIRSRNVNASVGSAGTRTKSKKGLTGTGKLLEGARHAYGLPKVSKEGKSTKSQRRARSGATPSERSCRDRNGLVYSPEGIDGDHHEDFHFAHMDLTERQSDFDGYKNNLITDCGEDRNIVQKRNDRVHPNIDNKKLDGMGHLEQLSPVPQNIRPPSAAYVDSTDVRPDSLFLSVVDTGAHTTIDVGEEHGDQPSMWVSDADKNSSYVQDKPINSCNDSAIDSNSRMLIADIISGFGDGDGA